MRCVVAWLLVQTLLGAAPATVREGDLVFQTSLSAQSQAIQRATASPYSHMGIVLFRRGQPCVFEAVATVRFTPLAVWIKRGKGESCVIKRLRNPLNAEQIGLLHQRAKAFEGKPYDLTFEWSDQRIYCSELVWKLYRQALGLEIGALQRLQDFNLDDPEVRTTLQARFGTAPPLHEPVISPAAMFDSPLLETVSADNP